MSPQPNVAAVTAHTARVIRVMNHFYSCVRRDMCVSSRRSFVVDDIDLFDAAALAAGGEVVLAAGATHTPQLLMLSGIGPAQELQRHGIQVVGPPQRAP